MMTKAAIPAIDAVVQDACADEAAALEEAEFHALYCQTAAPLRAYAARVLGDVTRADDIVQETFLRVLRRPPPASAAPARRAYVFRVASNLIVDGFRRQKRETAVAALREPRAPARDDALRLDMRRVFQRLRPRDRALMWLAHVEDADHREIAKALSLREGSVRVLLYRARRRLALLIRQTEHRNGGR